MVAGVGEAKGTVELDVSESLAGWDDAYLY